MCPTGCPVLFLNRSTRRGHSYRLQQNGRFAHSPDYIEDVALVIGWKIVASRKPMLRKEKGSWVAGIFGLCN
jgi:predicted TPR repeat methyltransferase